MAYPNAAKELIVLSRKFAIFNNFLFFSRKFAFIIHQTYLSKYSLSIKLPQIQLISKARRWLFYFIYTLQSTDTLYVAADDCVWLLFKQYNKRIETIVTNASYNEVWI